MKIPIKKIDDGFSLPVLGFGAYGITASAEHGVPINEKDDIDIIKRVIGLGITHFDTAESYAEGYSEIIIGKAIKSYDRKEFLITTKVSPQNLSYNKLINSAEGSLERLRTDYIDLYLIHYPNKKIPIEETMGALDFLVKQGLIKNIGVSNFNLSQFKEAQDNSESQIMLNQIPYSLINRMFEKSGFIEYAQRNDIMISAWRPLEGGGLANKKIGLLKDMCRKYDKTQSQIAINWLLSKKNIVTIPGSRNMRHIKENMGALGWQLDYEDIKVLDNNFPIKSYNSVSDEKWLKIISDNS